MGLQLGLEIALGARLIRRPLKDVLWDILWCCFLVGTLLAFFWRYLGWFGGEASFSTGDTTNIFWPLHNFNVREWLAGRLPLWNNSYSAGIPQLGNPAAGVFYPLSLVELVLAGRGGPMSGLYTRMWLDTCVAALGMYFLVRELTGNRAAAALSAVSFSCSGLVLGYAIAQISLIEALAWLPAILFFLQRSLSTTWSSVTIALGSFCIAAALLGGYPQMWLLMSLAGVALVVAKGRTGREVPWAHVLLRVGSMALLGAGLAALQLLPAAEFFLNSDRSVHLGIGGGYAWNHLAGLLVPGADGDLGLYVGVLAVALVPAALLLSTRRRLVLCWGAAAVVGLLAALGDTTPAYGAVFSHLGFGLFRNQAWNVPLAVVALSVLAGLGLDALHRRVPARLARATTVLPLIAAANLLSTNWGNNFPVYGPIVPGPERSPKILNTLVADQQREAMRFVVDGPADAFSPQGVGQYGLESVSSELKYRVQRTFQLTETDAFWRQWQLLNVRFIVSPRQLKGEGLAEVTAARDGPLHLFRMEHALPRAYLVWRARPVDTAGQALRAILDADFDPGGEVILEGDFVPIPTSPPQPSQKIDYRRLSPGEAAIQTESSAEGVLVLSEPHYPGWKITVDGQPAVLLRANYAFSAVHLPAGAHQVRFFYEPESFQVGLGISVATVVLICALIGRDLRRGRE